MTVLQSLRISAYVLMIAVFVGPGLSALAGLLSAPNDVSVGLGLFLIAALAGLGAWAGELLFRFVHSLFQGGTE